MRPVRTIVDTVCLPCEAEEYPLQITTTIQEVHDYGRAIPRGLVVHEDEIWIVSRQHDGWHLETKVEDVVAHQRGSNFVKWRNYLRRIVRWPWKDDDTQDILEGAE